MIKAVMIDNESHSLKTIGMLLNKYCPVVQVMEQCSDALTDVEAIKKFKVDLIFPEID